MIKHKKLMAFGSLACAIVGSLTFATAQNAVEQAQTSAPIASDHGDASGEGTKAYFIEMQQTAAAAQYAQTVDRYAAEMKYVGGANAEDNLKFATERAAAEANQQAWANDGAQHDLMSQINAAGVNVQVLFRAQTAVNGIAVLARPADLAALEQMPGVLRVTEIVTMQPDAVTSVDFIGTRTFWDNAGLNIHGENVGVGVIDTGIDFVHTGNGGPGGTNYAANATTTNGGTPATTFPTSKVVWGYDFAGDAYTAGTGPGATPVRDPNPMDTNGHGTGCASIIAGLGVNADGSAYTGDYTSVSPDISALRISPGIAPKASLYAFRVFGTSGSTGVASQAVDVAAAVRLWQLGPEGAPYPPAIANLNPAPVAVPRTPVLSVVNMSLGSPNGVWSPHNSDVVAVQNAAATGLSMVNSAGNSYDSYYIVGSASVATGTISVAASFNALMPGFHATAPATETRPELNLAAGSTGTPLFYTGPVELPPTPARYANPREANFQHLGNPGGGGTEAQQKSVALLNDAGQPVSDANGDPIPGVENPYIGKVVLVDRGDIGFHNKAVAAQRAQAAGVVIINNRPGALGGMSAASFFPNVTIPVIGMLQEHGAQLTASGAPNTPPARPGLEIAFLPQNAAGADEIVNYSSRGPRRTDSRLKPDMTAPAENVTVNSATTGNNVRSFNGTSSAAPHVAGAMALLRQHTNSHTATPAWTMEELKALIMNSASGTPTVGGLNGTIRYGISRAGVGRLALNGNNTANAVALSTEADFPVSLSFGQLQAPANGTATFTREFKVVDKSGGSTARSFAISYDAVNAPPGVTFDFPAGNTITVPAGGEATANVRITLDGPALRHARDLSTTATQVFAVGPPPTLLARTFPTEAGGRIVFTEQGGGGDEMRLSVHALTRPAADLAVTPAALSLPGTSGIQSFTFTGVGINTGDNVDTTVHPVADIKSYAKAFELQFQRASTQSDPQFKIGEVTHVGVTSDFARRSNPFDPATTSNQSAVMVFAVATAADFNTPGTNSFNSGGGPDIQILVDRTGDFVEELTVRSFAWNDATYGAANNGSNMYLTVTNPRGSGTVTTTGYYTNILLGRPTNTMNNNVQMLPVNLQRLGLTAANSRINYKVRAQFYFGTFVHETPWLTYDPAKPGLDASGPQTNEPFLNVGLPGGSFETNINTPQYNDNRSLGMMMVSMWNAPGDRVQAVRAPAQLAFIASRLPHGSPATVRELVFAAGSTAVESRRGNNFNSGTRVGDYQVVFRFSIPITAANASITGSSTGGSGTITSQSISGTDLIVNLSGVSDAQQLQFNISGVEDELGNNLGSTAANVGFLVGDVNFDGTTNSGDAAVVRNNSGASPTGNTAGSDVNRDGAINSGDAIIVRNSTGRSIFAPAP